MTTVLFVLTRILSNPLSNVFQKKLTHQSAHPLFIIFATHFLLSLFCLPFLGILQPAGLNSLFWGYIVLCVLLAVAGNTLIVAALRAEDLSVLGPINAYKSVVSLLLGTLLLGEFPTPAGFIGIALIILGSYFVMDRPPDAPRFNVMARFFKSTGIRLRFAALFLSAAEAIFLKKALLLSSPATTFIFWCFLGVPVAFAALVLFAKPGLTASIPRPVKNKHFYLLLALTTGLMQLSTLFTFGALQVGYSLALFQTSALLSVFFGYSFFQETNILRKLIGAGIMVAGAVLIVTFGSPA